MLKRNRETRYTGMKRYRGAFHLGRKLFSVMLLAFFGSLLLPGTYRMVYGGEMPIYAGEVTNPFTPGALSIHLTEPSFVPGTPALPGEPVAKDPTVVNDGGVAVMAFVEVRLPRMTFSVVEGGVKQPPKNQGLFTFTPNAGWQQMSQRVEESEVVYLYGYQEVLPPGASTVPLFNRLLTANYLEGSFTEGQEVLVDIEAFAIQSEAAGATLEEAYEKYLRDQDQ